MKTLLIADAPEGGGGAGTESGKAGGAEGGMPPLPGPLPHPMAEREEEDKALLAAAGPLVSGPGPFVVARRRRIAGLIAGGGMMFCHASDGTVWVLVADMQSWKRMPDLPQD